MKKENDVKVGCAPVKGIDLIRRVKSEPKRNFIWGGIREGSIGLFVGEGKTGKTTFAENLAISIAVGRNKFFTEKLSGVPEKVAFINLEEDYTITGDRLGSEISCLEEHEQDLFGENFYATPYDFPNYMNSEEDWVKLRNYIISTEARIIFIDSLTHLFVGEIERSATAQDLTKTLKDHIGSLGKTIIVVHHTTKGNDRPISQDKVAGSRIISQEFNWAYGFSKIPTEDGGKYMCHLFNKFQYADENIAHLYNMNENKWVQHLSSTNKFKLYKDEKPKFDGRKDTTNKDLILDFIASQYSQEGQTISSNAIYSEFVETSTMSKDTMYSNLKKLACEGKIVKESIGNYLINSIEGEDGKRDC